MKAIHLRTEYLENPVGIDIVKPRFFWQCQEGTIQTAYQIVAERDHKVVWDTDKVVSADMTHIRYEGEELHSRDQVSFKVRLWDENDSVGEWSEGTFEIGLLKSEDWTAKWITGDYKPNKKKRYPVDYFRKTFSLGKEILKARIYATARGVYDITLNGKRIEDFILAPGVTDYRKRMQYQTFDVTELLAAENTMELRLADGWYRGSVAAYGVTNVFGVQTSVLAQVEVTYVDGAQEVIGTDGSFAWSQDGPILFADLKDGEIVDASKTPSYRGKAKEVKSDIVPVASNNVPVKEQERLNPVLLTAKDGTKVLDFGQNIAGYLEFSLRGNKGQKIKLICGEVLGQDGKVNLSGIQESRPAKGWGQISLIKKLLGSEIKGDVAYTPNQEIVFSCSGGQDYYKTSFAVFGFRYAQVETDMDLVPEDFTAIAVYSDMEQVGDFTCSNEMMNQLLQNTRWSMKGNFLDIPTDCPTRERLGWTGDAQIFFDTGAYLMDTAAFFRKWIEDMKDNQYDNGLLSAVCPFQGVEMMYKSTGSSVGWADAIYLIPYHYYKRFGDKELLEMCWPMIKKYADYLFANLGMRDKKEARENPHNEYTYEKGIHLGEWLEPEEFRDKVYGTQGKHPEECTAYLHYAMTIIGEIAQMMGDDPYCMKCEQYAEGSKKAYKALFVDTGLLDTNRQAKLVRPLALGLLDGDDKKNAEARLKQAVENYHYCVGTGFLSTPFILPMLEEAEEVETAYKMLENTKNPGWLSEIEAGATTIWENWEGDLSQNHYSPGAVCQWLFESVAGIKPHGERHFIIKPVPGGSLTHAEATYQSIYGTVESGWEKTDGKTTFKIAIPVNTTARICLPDGTNQEVQAGTYTFTEEIPVGIYEGEL